MPRYGVIEAWLGHSRSTVEPVEQLLGEIRKGLHRRYAHHTAERVYRGLTGKLRLLNPDAALMFLQDSRSLEAEVQRLINSREGLGPITLRADADDSQAEAALARAFGPAVVRSRVR